MDIVMAGLQLQDLRVEKLNEDEELIVVPLSKNLNLINNKDKNTVNVLLLTMDKAKNIWKGNIVQYEADGYSSKLPENFFHNFYNFQNIPNSTITYLAIDDCFLYQYKYKDNNLTSYKGMAPKQTTAAASRTNGCTEWYLVTTVFFADGSQQTYEQYITTTCHPNCAPVSVIAIEGNTCDPGSGMGGNSNIISEYQSLAVKHWVAYTSPNGYNKLRVTDWLYGTIAPNNGNMFTRIVNQDIGIDNNFGSSHTTFATWYLYANGRTTFVSPDKKTGSTTVRGKLKWNNALIVNEVEINRTKTWNADVDLY